MRLFLTILLIANSFHFLWAQTPCTEDTIYLEVFFRQGESRLDTTFASNAKQLATFVQKVRTYSIHNNVLPLRLTLQGSGSPEGSSAINKHLSAERKSRVQEWFFAQGFHSEMFQITSNSVGVDWNYLSELVTRSNMSHREEILDLLQGPEWIVRQGKVVDGKKRRLQNLYGGRVWKELESRFFPQMRRGVLILYMPTLPTSETKVEDTDSLTVPLTVLYEPKADHPSSPIEAITHTHRPYYVAVKTNLVHDLCLVPNIGIEAYLGHQWSVAANWSYMWWKNDRTHYYWRIYGGDLEVRRWLGKKSQAKPLTGHHVGLYAGIVSYDVERGGRGYLGNRWSFFGGLSYGYSIPLARRLNLDLGIGLGYLGGYYKEYLPKDECYVWQATKNRHWVGPTKVEASLVWLIGRDNYNRKGGIR